MVYTGDVNELVSIIVMLLLYIGVYIYTVKEIKPNNTINILTISIIMRILFIIIDVYFWSLPNSRKESVTFELTGYNLATGLINYSSYNWDNYSKLIYDTYKIF